MKKVAVLGGGPAGSFAAERLARAGLDTVIFDEKLAWEKPCGGGLTYKAYNEYPFPAQNDTPKKLVTETYLAAPKAGAVKMALTQPLVIYSRFDLNHMLLERAEQAGAQMEKTRVLGMERKSRRLASATRATARSTPISASSRPARAIRCATSEPSGPRPTPCTRSATTCRPQQDHIDIQFLPNLEGYIWVFPRCGHLSVGICGKGEPAQSLRARLERYMEEKGIAYKDASFYGHVLPSLETPRLEEEPRGGRRLAGGRAMPAAWWIRSPAKACTTPCARATWPARWCSTNRIRLAEKAQPIATCCAAILRPIWSSAPRLPSVSSWAVPVQHRARAHGPVHPPQSAVPRLDAGSVRRHAALSRA